MILVAVVKGWMFGGQGGSGGGGEGGRKERKREGCVPLGSQVW